MKVSTIVIIALTGSLFLVSLLFGIVENNLNKNNSITDTVYINICINNTNNDTNNYEDRYYIFENIDLLNKFDILDEFNDKINIYSLDLNNCFNICETTKSCLGFIRFHNYCYLKNNNNIKDQTTSKDMNLFYRKNISNSKD